MSEAVIDPKLAVGQPDRSLKKLISLNKTEIVVLLQTIKKRQDKVSALPL